MSARLWVVAVRAAVPSPRPQAWQALQMAAGLAGAGRSVTLVADAPRPDGGPADIAGWLGVVPPSLRFRIPRHPHRPPLAGLLFRRALAAEGRGGPILLCRDPRIAVWALRRGSFAAVVHEWHVRPRPEDPRHRGALAATWHVPVAAGLRDDLLRAGVPEERIVLAPNACGLDPEAAAVRARRPRSGPVLALGLHRRGGLDLALDAWERCSDLPPLHIAGKDQGGARIAAWEARVAADPKLRGRVSFLGPRWGRSREATLDGCSVWMALYPDDADTRTRLCPLQVVDAAGSGLPLVTSDLPSIRALVPGAFFAAPGDAAALAWAVRAALASPGCHEPRPSWPDRAGGLAELVEGAL